MNADNKKLRRVVAYARVSTNKEDQANSLENQITYFQRELSHKEHMVLIDRNIPNICDKGVYYDKGRSGTKLRRPAFDELLKDAGLVPIIDAHTNEPTNHFRIDAKPKFDIICVKDTSRFARNVSINIVLRTLRENQVYVHFMDINKSTEAEEDFTAIQLFLTLAERESVDRSSKVKFGYEEGIKNGNIYIGGKMIGYNYIKDANKLVIDKKEAELVRLIFNLYTEEGLGEQRICNRLGELNYFNYNGHKYTRSTIRRILSNEKYVGITTSGKYHKIDVFSGKRIQRPYDDELRVKAREAQQKLLEKGIVKIEPIISKEQFEKAQSIRERNCEIFKLDGSWHGTTDYSKKLVCGTCGAYYRAQGRKLDSKGNQITYYACKHRNVYDESHGIPKCLNPSIKLSDLDNAVEKNLYKALKQDLEMISNTAPSIISHLKESLDKDATFEIEEIDAEIEKQNARAERLKEAFLDATFTKDEYIAERKKIESIITQKKERKLHLSEKNDYINCLIEQIGEVKYDAESELHELELSLQADNSFDRKKALRQIAKITIRKDGSINITTDILDIINKAFEKYGIPPLEDYKAPNENEEIIESATISDEELANFQREGKRIKGLVGKN